MLKISIDPRAIVLGALPHNGHGIEIGVHEAEFSEKVLRETKPKKLFLIDPWAVFDDDEHASSWYGSGKVTQKDLDDRYARVQKRVGRQKAVTIIRDFSHQVADQFEDESMDFVYVDGDHSYEAVKRDIALYGPKVKRGGYLIGDDFRPGQWWGMGVINAFTETLVDQSTWRLLLKVGDQIVLRKRQGGR